MNYLVFLFSFQVGMIEYVCKNFGVDFLEVCQKYLLGDMNIILI